jgi:hypothetical protein
MTSPAADLLEIYVRLSTTGLPSLIVGSVAASAYGEPRSTMDIDILVQAGPEAADRVRAAFPEDRFYVPPTETLRREFARGEHGTFNVIDSVTGLKADIYPAGNDTLNAYAFQHPFRCTLGGRPVTLAPATYIVALKLRYFALSRQDKHLRDIRAILAISADALDIDVIEATARTCGTEVEWRQCRNRVGEE